MKKLLTKDRNLIKEVENVLTQEGVHFITHNPNEEETIVAVLNRDGNSLYDAVNKTASGKKYYLGVLRNHPEYAIPLELVNRLNKVA